MKLTTRIITWKDRLKFGLLEDEIADRQRDLARAQGEGAALLLQDYLRLESTLIQAADRLQAEDVPHNHRAMGNVELLGSLLGAFVVLVVVLVVVMQVPL